MATIREYWEKDFSHILSTHGDWTAKSADGEIKITPKVHLDLAVNAKFISFLIPACTNLTQICNSVLSKVEEALKIADAVGEVRGGFLDHVDQSSKTLVFTKRVFIYSEGELPKGELETLKKNWESRGVHVCFRGELYLNNRNAIEKPLAFISHDSRDKDDVARELAVGLTKMMCPVWYDEFSLKVGDSLREKIEMGIKECKKCVLVLSQNFLTNSGWTKKEFDSIFTRELIDEKKLILPVWYGVTKKDVYNYSPSLADVVAVNWSLGSQKVISELYRSITSK
jgi:hypothetical protein